tara:strand:+ start:463 stop:1296 length:834 start_codon:yes stop_codon:yes gene_type:complete
MNYPTNITNKNINKVLAALRRPFVDEEVQWRVQRVGRNGSAMILCYVDARAEFNRLDTIVGPHNWQTNIVVSGNKNLAGVGININGDWVWKWDGAGDTAIEAQKGGISDAIKRACVQWGMARHLYDLPMTWVKIYDELPANVPKCRQVYINAKGTKGWAVAPSIRELQAHLLGPDELTRHIEDPKKRRAQRFVEVANALGIPKNDLAFLFEAASAPFKVDTGFTGKGLLSSRVASDMQLKIASHRILKWYDSGEVLDKRNSYMKYLTETKKEEVSDD